MQSLVRLALSRTWLIVAPSPVGRASRGLVLFVLTAAVALAGLGGPLLASVLSLAALIALSSLGLLRDRRALRNLSLLAALWATAQVVSNAYFGMGPLTQFVVAGPLAVAICLTLLRLRKETDSAVAPLVAAYSLGWAAHEVLARPQGFDVNPWKFGLAPPLIIASLAFLHHRRWPAGRQALALLAFAGVSLTYDSRFYAAACLATAMLTLAAGAGRLRRPRRARRMFTAGVAVLLMAYFAYPVMAAQGLLGERAQLQQGRFDANGVNFLAAARPEVLQAAYLTLRNPVLGVGGEAELTWEQSSGAVEFAKEIGGPTVNNNNYLLGVGRGGRGFVQHSSALDASVAAGLLALPFWFCLFALAIRAVFRAGRDGLPTAALLFTALLACWNALFSPLGSRGYVGLALATFLISVSHDERVLRRGPVPAAGGDLTGHTHHFSASA